MNEEYKGCTISPVSNEEGRYFGCDLPDVDAEGYKTEYVKVTFPNGNWVECADADEARKYIDKRQEQGRI